ncbi:hypothetical protein MKOR_36730 [Mycolicibacillus koreensis]|nr:hypothetical protein MKOR_36730 [Mycolicibacillus koreensis]
MSEQVDPSTTPGVMPGTHAGSSQNSGSARAAGGTSIIAVAATATAIAALGRTRTPWQMRSPTGADASAQWTVRLDRGGPLATVGSRPANGAGPKE